MKGETVIIPTYVSQTCSRIPARYEDKSVCGTGSRWNPGSEDLWGTASQCESCPYRVDIPSKYDTQNLEEIQIRKDIRVTELQIAYHEAPRAEF